MTCLWFQRLAKFIPGRRSGVSRPLLRRMFLGLAPIRYVSCLSVVVNLALLALVGQNVIASDPIQFDCAIQQYSATRGQMTTLWLRYFVSEDRCDFEVLWFEPHWLAIQYSTYPVSTAVSLQGRKSTFENHIRNKHQVFATPGDRPAHSNRFTYDVTDLRYSYLEMTANRVLLNGEAVRLSGESSNASVSVVRDQGAVKSVTLSKDGQVMAENSYLYSADNILKSMKSRVAEQQLTYVLPSPRTDAVLETVNGRTKSGLRTVTQEPVTFLSGGRKANVEFAVTDNGTFPKQIEVRDSSSNALIHKAVLSNFQSSNGLVREPDFLADAEYRKWIDFLVQTDRKSKVLHPDEEQAAAKYLERFSQRLDSSTSIVEQLRLVRTSVLNLSALKAEENQLAPVLRLHFDLLIKSGCESQVIWNGIPLQGLAIYENRPDLLPMIRKEWLAAVSKLPLPDSVEIVRLATGTWIGDEWFTLPLLDAIAKRSDVPVRTKAVVLASQIGLLSRVTDGTDPAQYLNRDQVRAKIAQATASLDEIMVKRSRTEKAEIDSLRSSLQVIVIP